MTTVRKENHSVFEVFLDILDFFLLGINILLDYMYEILILEKGNGLQRISDLTT